MNQADRVHRRRRKFRKTLNTVMTIRTGGEEFLCRARDVSEDGLGFVIENASIKVDEPIEATVVVDNVVQRFVGAIVYFRPLRPGAVRVGIRFGDPPPAEASKKERSEGAVSENSNNSWAVAEDQNVDAHTTVRKARRSKRRKRVRLQVWVDPGRRPGVVEDISEIGAFLWSSMLRPTGEQLRLTIRSAHGVQPVTATVKWVRRARGNDTFSTQTGMGIAFSEPLQDLEGFLRVYGQTLR